MQSLIAVGTSAGGRQPKAIIAINKETGEIRSGQIAGQEGYEYYILKFGDQERSSAELEMAYHDMAIAQFRTYANKYDVKEKWVNAVETTLMEHLAAWGYCSDMKEKLSIEIDGKLYQDIKLEQAYKGNFHLIAAIDGKERKFVIGKNKPEYSKILSVGINQLKAEDLFDLVKKYLAHKE